MVFLNLKKIRVAKGISQKKLSEATGIPQQTLSYYEKALPERVSYKSVRAIAAALEIPEEILLDNVNR